MVREMNRSDLVTKRVITQKLRSFAGNPSHYVLKGTRAYQRWSRGNCRDHLYGVLTAIRHPGSATREHATTPRQRRSPCTQPRYKGADAADEPGDQGTEDSESASGGHTIIRHSESTVNSRRAPQRSRSHGTMPTGPWAECQRAGPEAAELGHRSS